MAIQRIEDEQTGVLLRDGEPLHHQVAVFDWMIRRYFPKEVERLKGDSDYIGFTKVVFHADAPPEVEYSTWDES